ncbi:unnamed protein product [Prunus armeniaca]
MPTKRLGGIASDSRVLRDAITRPNGLRVPTGYYYLVDGEYTNGEGFLTPYRGTRYHLSEWREGNTPDSIYNSRMESEGNNQNFEQGKKGTRRSWSKFEEDAFFTVLDEFVAVGHRCETGSFKSGIMVQMEKALNIKCLNSGLKACPHIESKLKKWKKQYSIVYDMINTNGFAWNDIKKCVEVDSNDTWETYVHHHKEAAEWRSKPFPLFNRLSNIFGNDRANGQRAKVPADMMEEQSNNEVNASDNCVQ